MNGFNLKYRYEQDNNPLGVIGSFTYTEKDRTDASGDYNKTQYYGITAGPAYRLNDWASIYGVVGVGYGKFQNAASRLTTTPPATTVSLTVLVCSSTRSKTLLWTSPTSRAVFVALTLAPGSLAWVTASNHFGDMKNPPLGADFLPAI
jgi:opacity protein-like surface antigen